LGFVHAVQKLHDLQPPGTWINLKANDLWLLTPSTTLITKSYNVANNYSTHLQELLYNYLEVIITHKAVKIFRNSSNHRAFYLVVTDNK